MELSSSSGRLDRLRDSLSESDLDGYLASDPKNIYYLTGFKDISDATLALIVSREDPMTLWTYPLSLTAAVESARDCSVKSVSAGEKFLAKVGETIRERRIRRVGFDSLSAEQYLALSQSSPDLELAGKQDMMLGLRSIKSPEEIRCMREAATLADLGVRAGLESIREGVHEYEVAAEIEYAMRREGSEGVAFETLVASGPRSAYAHGVASNRVIRRGEFVTMDLGAVFFGYRSDLTRTVFVGQPSDKEREIFEIVLSANRKAFERMRPGVCGRDVDAEARTLVKESGYGERFIHSLGHGIGLNTHELPRASPTSADVLTAGNVLTDEPGIYIEGYGGVRIEDTVLIIGDGAESLTKSDRSLLP